MLLFKDLSSTPSSWFPPLDMGTRLQRHSGARFYSRNNWTVFELERIVFINFQIPAGHIHIYYWIEIYWFFLSIFIFQLVTIIYSIIGIPLFFLFLQHLGFSINQISLNHGQIFLLGGSLLLFLEMINLCLNNFSYFRKNNVAHFSFSLLATLLCHVYYQEEGDKCFSLSHWSQQWRVNKKMESWSHAIGAKAVPNQH